VIDYVVLAAGIGVRMRAISGRPKPLLEVAGTTLLGLVLDVLRHGGASRVYVVAAPHLRGEVEVVGWRLGLDVIVVENQWWWRENGYSLLLAASVAEAPKLLVAMSDHVLHPAIVSKVASALVAGSYAALVGGDSYAYYVDHGEATRIQTAPEGRVVKVGKNILPYSHVDVGVLGFDKSYLSSIAVDAEATVKLSDIVNSLASRYSVAVADVTGLPWTDVDSDFDYYELLAGRTRIVLDQVLEALRR
jgi:choline kinase